MFVILTKKRYNEISNSVLGVPISSFGEKEDKEKEKNDHFRETYGIDISNDDIIDDSISNYNLYKKRSVVLCDRPCRINKSDVVEFYECVKIDENKYQEVINALQNFIENNDIQALSNETGDAPSEEE